MSMQQIKSDLETFLNTNITTTVIKWSNTTTYTLNSVPLTSTEINSLTEFLQPNITSLSTDIELLSTVDDVNFVGLFEYLIYIKKGYGTGGMYTIGDSLRTAFKKQTINGIKTMNFSYEPSYIEGDWVVLPCSVEYRKWDS